MPQVDAAVSGRASHRVAHVLFAVLLAAGLAFLIWPIAKDAVFEKGAAETVAAYSDTVAGLDGKQRDEMLARAGEYNAALAEGTARAGKGYSGQLDVNATGVMSRVSIPSISVDLPVYHGTGEDVLAKGVGHMSTTSLPVGGKSTHCVLTGHSGLSQTRLFDDLSLLGEGDVFYLETLGEKMAYRVFSIEVVEPDDVSTLKIQEGRDLVTLVTCYPYGVNSHRLLVHGERCEVDGGGDGAASVVDSRFFRKYMAPVVLFLLVLLVVLVLRFAGSRIRRHRKKGTLAAAAPRRALPRPRGREGVSLLALAAFAIAFVIAFYPYAQQVVLELSYERTADAVSDGSILSADEGGGDQAGDRLLAAARAYNASLVSDGQQFEDAWTFEQASSSLAGLVDSRFGTIRIPDMDVKLPLLLGASYDNMAEGAAVLGGTSIPIGGESTNSVIAGHRGWRYWPYFRDIERLVPGKSMVYIDNLWGTLAYRVVSTEIIAPTDTDKIRIQEGRDLVTLVTCHPYMSHGLRRYVVTCERVMDCQDIDDGGHGVVASLAATVSDLAYLSEGLEEPQHCAGIIALEQMLRLCFAVMAVLLFTGYIVGRLLRRREGKGGELHDGS